MTEEREKDHLAGFADLHDEGVLTDGEYCHALVWHLPLVDSEAALAALTVARLRSLRTFLAGMPRSEEEWGRYRVFLIGEPDVHPFPARTRLRAGVELARTYLARTGVPGS